MHFELYLGHRAATELGYRPYRRYGNFAACATTLRCSTTTASCLIDQATSYAYQAIREGLDLQPKTFESPRTGAQVVVLFYDEQDMPYEYSGLQTALRVAKTHDLKLREPGFIEP